MQPKGLTGLVDYTGHTQPTADSPETGETEEPTIEPYDPLRYYTLPKDTRFHILASTPESALATYLFCLRQLNTSKWSK